jgi:signal transduction histidine kinase
MARDDWPSCIADSHQRSFRPSSADHGQEHSAESHYICVAADLLGRMMAQLQTLETNNRRLTLAMATAGHDLRQWLHSLLGLIELLGATTDTSRRSELSQRAKSLIVRLAGELEQLALQAGGGHSRPGVPGVLISGVLERLKTDWESEAAAKGLNFRVEDVHCSVDSDQRLLAVILNNVVGNAVRHTREGEVRVACAIEGPFLVLSVTDSGPGISDEDLYRSFALSSGPRGFGEGLGLGLSIARKTAEMLGHEFAVSTAADKGTCIRLRVPLAG